MGVVNHRYLSRKLLGDGMEATHGVGVVRVGVPMLTVGWLLLGRGAGRLARGRSRGTGTCSGAAGLHRRQR